MAVLRVLHRASPLRFEILRSPCRGNPKPVVSDFSSSAPLEILERFTIGTVSLLVFALCFDCAKFERSRRS